jgi:hypothetical protein
MNDRGWIGVDLDGTLAEYDGWKGINHIGKPIPKMLERVKAWLLKGETVKIFTARVSRLNDGFAARRFIENWCLANLGAVLPVTYKKDLAMRELWDDRCVQVIPNTGERADGKES